MNIYLKYFYMLAAVTLGMSFTVRAEDMSAGPLFNQADAAAKCPNVCKINGDREWSGHWHTTVWGRESVCDCIAKPAAVIPPVNAHEPTPPVVEPTPESTQPAVEPVPEPTPTPVMEEPKPADDSQPAVEDAKPADDMVKPMKLRTPYYYTRNVGASCVARCKGKTVVIEGKPVCRCPR